VDVGDIGYPDLVYGVYFDISDQVRIDPEPMITIRCSHPFLPGTTLQSLLAHDPGHLLVVDSPAFPVELYGDSSIPVTRKLQTDITNTGLQNFIMRFFFLLMVKTPPR